MSNGATAKYMIFIASREKSAHYKIKQGMNLIILNVTHLTLFFSHWLLCNERGSSEWALLLITSSVLKPLERHLTCKLHSPHMEFQKKKSLKLSRIWSFDRTSHCHFWQTENEVFWELTHPPHELAGWAGRVASSKLNDCTHPPTTSWGGRGNKKSQTTNKDNWSTTWLNMSWDLLVFRIWIFCWQKKLQSLFVCLGLSVPSHAVND